MLALGVASALGCGKHDEHADDKAGWDGKLKTNIAHLHSTLARGATVDTTDRQSGLQQFQLGLDGDCSNMLYADKAGDKAVVAE